MKQIYSLMITTLLFTGCVNTSSMKVPDGNNLETLKDVGYKIDKKNGSVEVEKVYQKNIQSSKNDTAQKDEKSLSYERVPLFEKEHINSVSFKGKKKQNVYIHNGKIKVAVESIPVNEFIDLVFGSVLKLNYTVDDSIKKINQTVTLNMQESIDAKMFYKIVEKILQTKGISLSVKNNVIFITKSNLKSNDVEDLYIAYGKKIPASLEDSKNVMLFVPYDYINPKSVDSLLRIAGVHGVKTYKYIRGMQMMFGTAGNVKKALKMVSLLDRPYMDGKIPYLLQLKNIKAENFISKMKKIFIIGGINVTSKPAQGGITMLAMPDLNMVYVVTPKKKWMDMLLYWKEKLDIASTLSQEPSLYIYHVKNRKADELAAAIKEVLGLAKTTTTKDEKVTKEANKKQIKTKRTKAVSKSSLVGRVNYTPTVTADLDTNILMLKLTPMHYKLLLPFIKQLDKLPLQTLVEVTVAEVTLTDTFSLGFEYAIRNQSAGLVESLLNISGSGSGLGVVYQGNYLDATINAFAQKELLDIVSRPKILILNNKTGNINVGTQVPIVTSEVSATDVVTTTSPTINRNISYRNTGINLGLTPTINSHGVLTMNIDISLSEAQINDTSGIDSPLIIDRKLSTVAVINSGDTILIGGLISHNKSKSKGGVPFLKDIPYIGNIFATNSDKTSKTELIMLIRPVIIETKEKLLDETYKYKKIMTFLNTKYL